MSDWIDACGEDEVSEGGCRSAGGAVIVRLDGELHAVAARCPHMGYPMNKGTLRDGVITCAWHKWEFDLRSGGCYRGACDDLPVYPLRVVDGRIEIQRSGSDSEREREARRLREGLMMGDVYLQAKAVAGLLAAGGGVDDVAAVGLAQGFAHGVAAHPTLQAAIEVQAVLDAAELAPLVGERQRTAVLLQGLRMAGGRSGDRPAVVPLPPPHDEAALLRMLRGYVDDPSRLGLERILLTLDRLGTDPARIEAELYALATRSCFIDFRQAVAAIARLWPALADRLDERAALCAWVLGTPRDEPEPDARDAIAWLERHGDELTALDLDARDTAVDADEVASALEVNAVAPLFDRVLAWLRAGCGFTGVLDAISLCCARRFDRLWLNNGGLWDTATEGLRLCHALRSAAERQPGAWRARGLLLLAYHLFDSRWLQAGRAWSDDADEIDWPAYERAIAARDLDRARALAVAGLAADRAALGAWLAPLAREDLSADQLATIVAACGESRHQEEWQPYLAGIITWVLDASGEQTVATAAKFGRSIVPAGG